MTYRDGRRAYEMLDEVSKIKGVARRTGYYNVKGNPNPVLGYELAVGDRAREVKRARGIGAGVGGVTGAIPGLIAAGPAGAVGLGVLGALAGYAIGDELGWGKARGVSGKKTNLYTGGRARKEGIREYQATGKRPKSGSRKRKDVHIGDVTSGGKETPVSSLFNPDIDEEAAWL